MRITLYDQVLLPHGQANENPQKLHSALRKYDRRFVHNGICEFLAKRFSQFS
jgi:hypothetical protein